MTLSSHEKQIKTLESLSKQLQKSEGESSMPHYLEVKHHTRIIHLCEKSLSLPEVHRENPNAKKKGETESYHLMSFEDLTGIDYKGGYWDDSETMTETALNPKLGGSIFGEYISKINTNEYSKYINLNGFYYYTNLNDLVEPTDIPPFYYSIYEDLDIHRKINSFNRFLKRAFFCLYVLIWWLFGWFNFPFSLLSLVVFLISGFIAFLWTREYIFQNLLLFWFDNSRLIMQRQPEPILPSYISGRETPTGSPHYLIHQKVLQGTIHWHKKALEKLLEEEKTGKRSNQIF